MPQIEIALRDENNGRQENVKRKDPRKAFAEILLKIYQSGLKSLGVPVRNKKSAEYKKDGYAGVPGIQISLREIFRYINVWPHVLNKYQVRCQGPHAG